MNATKKKDLFEFIQTSQVTFIGSEENNPLLTSLVKMSENMVDIDFQLLRLENRVESLETAIANRKIEDLPETEIMALLSSGEDEGVLGTLMATARGSGDAIHFHAVAMLHILGSDTQLLPHNMAHLDKAPNLIERSNILRLQSIHPIV